MSTMNAAAFGALTYDQQSQALQKYMIPIEQAKFERSCGDGRKAKNGSVFVKNFGGSLGSATVAFVSGWIAGKRDSYGAAVDAAIKSLATKFDLGGHRDEHNDHNPTTSGCGYADNRQAIVSRIATTEGFDGIINSVFDGAIHDGNRATWDQVLAAYKAIDEAQGGGFTPTGEELISGLEAKDSTILMLEGDHEEYAIIFNYVPNTTFDTNRLVDNGGQAFCVDIWDAMAQTQHLGIDDELAKLIYMAEWVATALVLVVDKGKDLPPIFHFKG